MATELLTYLCLGGTHKSLRWSFFLLLVSLSPLQERQVYHASSTQKPNEARCKGASNLPIGRLIILPAIFVSQCLVPLGRVIPLSIIIVNSQIFISHTFEDSFLNSSNDSAMAIADARYCTLCLCNSIVAHPWRALKKQKSASCSPIIGIFKSSSWNSLTYSYIWQSLCWRHRS